LLVVGCLLRVGQVGYGLSTSLTVRGSFRRLSSCLLHCILGHQSHLLIGGPRQLSAEQADAMSAAARLAVSQPSVSTEFTSSQASTRPPTPLSSDIEDSKERTEGQKRRLASARRRSSRAGGQATVGMSGSTDTRVPFPYLPPYDAL
jgi:hypothetical protein